MAISPYLSQVISDDGNTYNSQPAEVVLPTEPFKYFTMTYKQRYNPRLLADIVYGDVTLWWLITKSNGFINPYNMKIGDKIKILKPEYINEIVFIGG